MSELLVVGFPNETQAEEVRQSLFRMEKEYLLELEDAVVVVKNQAGKLSVHQNYNLVESGAGGGIVLGSLWGLLLGVLFFNPILGFATGSVAGGAIGGITGWLTDIGIDDTFIKELGNTIQPGHSALFILVKKITPDKVLNHLKQQNVQGRILHTSLSVDDETRLKEILQSKLPETGL